MTYRVDRGITGFLFVTKHQKHLWLKSLTVVYFRISSSGQDLNTSPNWRCYRSNCTRHIIRKKLMLWYIYDLFMYIFRHATYI